MVPRPPIRQDETAHKTRHSEGAAGDGGHRPCRLPPEARPWRELELLVDSDCSARGDHRRNRNGGGSGTAAINLILPRPAGRSGYSATTRFRISATNVERVMVAGHCGRWPLSSALGFFLSCDAQVNDTAGVKACTRRIAWMVSFCTCRHFERAPSRSRLVDEPQRLGRRPAWCSTGRHVRPNPFSAIVSGTNPIVRSK